LPSFMLAPRKPSRHFNLYAARRPDPAKVLVAIFHWLIDSADRHVSRLVPWESRFAHFPLWLDLNTGRIRVRASPEESEERESLRNVQRTNQEEPRKREREESARSRKREGPRRKQRGGRMREP